MKMAMVTITFVIIALFILFLPLFLVIIVPVVTFIEILRQANSIGHDSSVFGPNNNQNSLCNNKGNLSNGIPDVSSRVCFKV